MATYMRPWLSVLIGCIIGGIVLIPLVGIYIAIIAFIISFGIGLIVTGGFK